MLFRALKECIDSLTRKIIKFYPLYFVFIFVAATFNYSDLKDLILNILLLQSYAGEAKIALSYNWVTWFLSSLTLAYFLSPLINRFVSNHLQKISVLIFSIFFILFIQLFLTLVFGKNSKPYDFGYWFLYQCPAIRLLDFIHGCLIANIYIIYFRNNLFDAHEGKINIPCVTFSNIKETFFYGLNRLVRSGGGDIISFSLIILILFYRAKFPGSFSYTFLWILPSIYLVFSFCCTFSFLTKYLASEKILCYLGERSFEIFIIHRLSLHFASQLNKSFLSWFFCVLGILLLCETYRLLQQEYKKMKSNNFQINF